MKERYYRIHMYGDFLIPFDTDGQKAVNALMNGIAVGTTWTKDPNTGTYTMYKTDFKSRINIEEIDPDFILENEKAAIEQDLENENAKKEVEAEEAAVED